MLFTTQEKQVLVFFVLSIAVGSFGLLLKKHHPAVERAFIEPFQKVIQQKININSATLNEWESLPAIGSYRARRIIEAREYYGKFESIDDVRYVKGIGPYVFNQIEPFLSMD